MSMTAADKEPTGPPPADLTDPPPDPAAVRVYNVPTVADMLGVSQRYVWKLIADGELARVEQGTRRGVRDDDLADYIERHTSRNGET